MFSPRAFLPYSSTQSSLATQFATTSSRVDSPTHSHVQYSYSSASSFYKRSSSFSRQASEGPSAGAKEKEHPKLLPKSLVRQKASTSFTVEEILKDKRPSSDSPSSSSLPIIVSSLYGTASSLEKAYNPDEENKKTKQKSDVCDFDKNSSLIDSISEGVSLVERGLVDTSNRFGDEKNTSPIFDAYSEALIKKPIRSKVTHSDLNSMEYSRSRDFNQSTLPTLYEYILSNSSSHCKSSNYFLSGSSKCPVTLSSSSNSLNSSPSASPVPRVILSNKDDPSPPEHEMKKSLSSKETSLSILRLSDYASGLSPKCTVENSKLSPRRFKNDISATNLKLITPQSESEKDKNDPEVLKFKAASKLSKHEASVSLQANDFSSTLSNEMKVCLASQDCLHFKDSTLDSETSFSAFTNVSSSRCPNSIKSRLGHGKGQSRNFIYTKVRKVSDTKVRIISSVNN